MRSYISATGIALSLLAPACSGGGHEAGHASGTGGTTGNNGGGTERLTSIPNPAVLVANGNGTVTVIDPTSLEIASSAAVMEGMHPHHVSVSPDGIRVLITATTADLSLGHSAPSHAGHGGSSASTMVYSLDLESRELQDIITIDATAHNAAFTPDGTTIVLGMMEHGMIAGYDATTLEDAFTAEGFMMPLEVTPTGAGSLLVAESGASRVALFDLSSRTVTTQFEVGAVPVAAWASGGSHYFVSVEEGMQVRHLLEDGAAITLDDHTIEPEGMPGQAVLDPSGQELWVAVEDRAVVAIFDATTHEKLAEFAAGTKPHGIVFEPGGERAFLTDEEGGKVLVVDVASRAVSSEIALGGKPNGIAWLSR